MKKKNPWRQQMDNQAAHDMHGMSALQRELRDLLGILQRDMTGDELRAEIKRQVVELVAFYRAAAAKQQAAGK